MQTWVELVYLGTGESRLREALPQGRTFGCSECPCGRYSLSPLLVVLVLGLVNGWPSQERGQNCPG